MKRYLCTLLLLVPALSFALTPVTINSASINYTTHTLSVAGSGFCTGVLPAVTFNTTRLKVTSACSSSVVVASLPVQAAGSYRLIIANSTGAAATFYVTYGAVGPQGPQGFTGATGATGTKGATGAIGPQGPIGLTGATGAQGSKGDTGATGMIGPQGLQGLTGVVGLQGPMGLTGAQGPQGLPGTNGVDGAQGPQGILGQAGPQGIQGPQGPQGATGPAGTNGLDGVQGLPGTVGVAGPQGPAGPVGNLNWKGAWSSGTTYNPQDAVTFSGTSYIALQSNVGAEPDIASGTPTTDNVTVTFYCNPLTNNNGMNTDCTSFQSANISGGMNTLTFSVPPNPQNYPNNGESFFIESLTGSFNGTPVTLSLTYNDMTQDPWNGSLMIQVQTPGQYSFQWMPIVLTNALCLNNQASCPASASLFTGTVLNPTMDLGSISVVSGSWGIQNPGSVTYFVAQPINNSWAILAAAGTQGAAGAPGIVGPQGATGAAGVGIQGPQGLQGNTGAVGAQGPQGVQGPAGANGTGFTSRGTWNPATSYAVNDVVSFAPTMITYNVNLTFGAAGSAVGTITTDGTQGVLSPSNIVSWNLTLTDHGTNSTILTQANSAASEGAYNSGGAANNDFSATLTTLLFNYGMGDAGSWSIAGASGQLCFTSYSNCFGPSNTYGTWSINGDSQWTYSGAGGSQVVATGGVTTHGGTSTYVATGPVAAGTVPGTLPWAMMAQAGTPGTPGATGPQGPIGLSVQGPSGPQGPQGPTGPAGPAGGSFATPQTPTSASLNGTYSFQYSNLQNYTWCATAAGGAFSGTSFETSLGVLTFDGNGNVTMSGTDYNRVPNPDPTTGCSSPWFLPPTKGSFTGTYNVSSDGTGAMIFNDGDSGYVFVLAGTTANGIIRSTMMFDNGPANNNGTTISAPNVHNSGSGTAVLQ